MSAVQALKEERNSLGCFPAHTPPPAYSPRHLQYIRVSQYASLHHQENENECVPSLR